MSPLTAIIRRSTPLGEYSPPRLSKRKPPFLMRVIQCSRCSLKDMCVAWGGPIPCLWELTIPKRCLTFKPRRGRTSW